MLEVLAAFIGIAVVGLVVWRRSRRPLVPESLFQVEVSNGTIFCTSPEGVERTVSLSEVSSIRIQTNDSGPWGLDVLWGFHGPSGEATLVVPSGATGEQSMLETLSRLPGWRDEQVISAMGCTSNREFVCWERDKNGNH